MFTDLDTSKTNSIFDTRTHKINPLERFEDPKATAIMTFDVTDKQYQLKDDIKPDKESTWKYPKEKDGKQILPRLLARSLILRMPSSCHDCFLFLV